MSRELTRQTNKIILGRISDLVPHAWSSPETIASVEDSYRKWITKLESFTAEYYVSQLSKTALQTRNLFETTYFEEQMVDETDSDRAFITYFFDALDIGPEHLPQTTEARAESLKIVLGALRNKFDPKPSD